MVRPRQLDLQETYPLLLVRWESLAVRRELALRQSETVFRNSVRHSETLLAFGLTSQKTATPGDEITLPLVETTALRIRGA